MKRGGGEGGEGWTAGAPTRTTPTPRPWLAGAYNATMRFSRLGTGGGEGGEGVGGGAGGARERVCEGLGGVLNLAEQGGASASPPAV